MDQVGVGELNVKTEDFANDVENGENSTASEEPIFPFPSLFTSKTLIELSNSSWTRSRRANEDVQPYLRGCKWSPDGTCCLSVVNNDGVHVTELSADLYEGSVAPNRIIDVMDSVIHVKECGLIYDFCWFPRMNSRIPDTCCWLTTRQNAPVQMWDAYDGSLRCSYRGFDSVDQMEPAISVTFSTFGGLIIAGYKKAIRIFDVERPGREFIEHKIKAPAACLAVCDDLLAVGSWNTTVSLYSANTLGNYKSIGVMHGHGGGVTQVKFTPDGRYLVSGARKDNRLLLWDIRHFRRPLNILSRVVDTNQRIYFDISPCGKYLVSGGTDGVIKVWDEDQVPWKSALEITEDMGDTATYKFPLHKDCCNSVSIHPIRPILATGSGQYHIRRPMVPSPEPKIEVKNQDSTPPMIKTENSSDESTVPTQSNKRKLEDRESPDLEIEYTDNTENSLVFWWIGEVPDLT